MHKKLFGFWALLFCVIPEALDTYPLLQVLVPFSTGVMAATPRLPLHGFFQEKEGLKSNKIPFASCSSHTVLTNYPQKVRFCNGLTAVCLLLKPCFSSMGRQAGEISKKHPCLGKAELPAAVLRKPSSNRRLCQHSAVSFAWGVHTSLDTSALSYRCSTAFWMEPLTVQLFEHMCIFHSTNRKNMAAGLQRLTPRARIREAEEVFLWEISVFSPVVSFFPISFADCATLRPWGR